MLIIGLNMAAIFQPVLLLLFLLQTADTVHRSDTSMHPGGFILAETIKPNHIEVACTASIVSASRNFFLAIAIYRILNIPDIHLTVSLLNSYQGYHSRFPDLCLFCNRTVAASDKKKNEVYIINVTEHAS